MTSFPQTHCLGIIASINSFTEPVFQELNKFIELNSLIYGMLQTELNIYFLFECYFVRMLCFIAKSLFDLCPKLTTPLTITLKKTGNMFKRKQISKLFLF